MPDVAFEKRDRAQIAQRVGSVPFVAQLAPESEALLDESARTLVMCDGELCASCSGRGGGNGRLVSVGLCFGDALLAETVSVVMPPRSQWGSPVCTPIRTRTGESSHGCAARFRCAATAPATAS